MADWGRDGIGLMSGCPITSFHKSMSKIIYLHLAINRKEVTARTWLDLSDAFDTIDHSTLFNILRTWFGIECLSYLTRRQQRIKVGDATSNPFALRFGLPRICWALFLLCTLRLSAKLYRNMALGTTCLQQTIRRFRFPRTWQRPKDPNHKDQSSEIFSQVGSMELQVHRLKMLGTLMLFLMRIILLLNALQIHAAPICFTWVTLDELHDSLLMMLESSLYYRCTLSKKPKLVQLVQLVLMYGCFESIPGKFHCSALVVLERSGNWSIVLGKVASYF